MKFIKGKVLFVVLACAVIAGTLGTNWGKDVIAAEDSSLLEIPKPTTSTNNYVPRIGESMSFYIHDFSFENTATGLTTRVTPMIIYNYESPTNNSFNMVNDAQSLNKIVFPHMVLGQQDNGEWLYEDGMVNAYPFGINDGSFIQYLQTNPGETVEFTKEQMWHNVDGYRVQGYLVDYHMPSKDQYVEYPIHKLTADGPIEFQYDVVDRGQQDKAFALFSGYTNYKEQGGSVQIPKQWTYYETSDIVIRVLDAKDDYQPGDEVAIEMTIKNHSNVIPNGRLVPGIDFGDKEIVSNPTFTEGTPDYQYNVISKFVDNKTALMPGEEFSVQTTITLPDDFTNYLNANGDALVLTPFLYTSNMYQELGSTDIFSQMHYEEREYNTGIELPVKKQYTVTYTDGVDDEVVFDDQVYTVKENENTPEFVGVPERDGYTFEGWNPVVEDTVSKDITYTATWAKIEIPAEKTFTVTYTDGVDNEEVFKDQVYTVKLNSLTPKFIGTPKRTGYTFKGWDRAIESIVNRNITYTAVWEKDVTPVEETFNITYDGNGYTSGEVPVDPTDYKAGSKAIVLGRLTMGKDGYEFIGWRSGNSDIVLLEGDALDMTQDYTLVAQWSKVQTPGIPTDPNKPSVTPPTVEPQKPTDSKKPETPSTGVASAPTIVYLVISSIGLIASSVILFKRKKEVK